MIKIPRHIETVPPQLAARLLEKQWRARVALRKNPLAYAFNLKWKMFFRDSAKVIHTQKELH